MKKTLLMMQKFMRPAEVSVLERDFHVIKLWEQRDPEATIQENKDRIVALVSSLMPVRRELIQALPNLEIITNIAVGVDNIDLETAKERGIVVTNTPDVLTDDTADIALALVLSLSRRIVEADMYVRVGRWPQGALPLGTRLSGKTVGIVGLGRIGRAIAARLEAFGVEVVYHGRKSQEDQSYKYYADLKEMAGLSDFLIVSCAGGAGTKGLIDLKIMKALGSSGYLINVARGSVVDEGDLQIALVNRDIAGAGLDVFENEPNVPEALFKMDNVVLLPHIGSATIETRGEMGQLVIDNLLAHFNGDPLLTQV